MSYRFPFEKEHSSLFRSVYRPYLPVLFWSRWKRRWLEVYMIVDSGADYSLLPKQYIEELGINPNTEAVAISTEGVGGSSKVFFLRQKQRVKLAIWERKIPLGIVDSVEVPPLMGRHQFLETFSVCFHGRVIEIDNLRTS